VQAFFLQIVVNLLNARLVADGGKEYVSVVVWFLIETSLTVYLVQFFRLWVRLKVMVF